MIWETSWKADPRAREVADRHYNRQKPGTPQFVPPGRALVLYAETETGRAFWITSYPYAQYVRHAWAVATALARLAGRFTRRGVSECRKSASIIARSA